MTNSDLLLKLFLQLAAILCVCRAASYVGKKYLGQSEVVCEMVAGIMMGPSLLGLFAPEFQNWLFPQAKLMLQNGTQIPNPSMSVLYALSNIGLVLYMFVTGLELDMSMLREKAKSAAVVSTAGLVTPFAVGLLAAYVYSENHELFAQNGHFWFAALFLGASMSITSLPMLARIIKERGIAQTRFGTLGLAAASVDDLAAWCLLALILAGIKSSVSIAAVTIGGGLAYILFIALIGRPLFKIFARMTERDGDVKSSTLSVVMIVLVLSAWFTDWIAIDAVFGAFWLGAVMPRGEFSRRASEQIERITTALLLPVFFAYSGLNTQIGLLHSPSLWMIAAVIMLLAVVCKGVACMLAARWSGENWHDASAIGAMMNTRGLMELIILNIGLRYGLITPVLFTIMVLMAIVTTVMCSPLLTMLGYRIEQKSAKTQ